MIGNIIFWLIIIYIVGIVLWRLFVSIMLIAEGYKTGGIKGGGVGIVSAIGVNLLMLLGDIWGLAKFAIGALIVIWIIRACSN